MVEKINWANGDNLAAITWSSDKWRKIWAERKSNIEYGLTNGEEIKSIPLVTKGQARR